MSYKMARLVHVLLMAWVTWLFLFGWLPLLRSLMDGPSYEWGTTLLGLRFAGAGMAGDLWFLVLKTGIGLAMLWAGWRRPNGAFRAALVLWLALMLLDALHAWLAAPGLAVFEGETLGISISLELLAPILQTFLLALAIWWAYWAPPLSVPRLGRSNLMFLSATLLLLPVQYLLLRAGHGQETRDVVGVLLTIGSWFALSLGLAPWGLGRREPEVLIA